MLKDFFRGKSRFFRDRAIVQLFEDSLLPKEYKGLKQGINGFSGSYALMFGSVANVTFDDGKRQII
jgi:hypothetical protein